MKPVQTGLSDDQVGPSVEDIQNAYTDEDRETLSQLLNLLAAGLPGLKVEANLAIALQQFVQYLHDDNELLHNIECAMAFDTARFGHSIEQRNEYNRSHVVCSYCRVEHHIDAMPTHMKTCALHPYSALHEKVQHALAIIEEELEGSMDLDARKPLEQVRAALDDQQPAPVYFEGKTS